jgi:hypothetical protein
MTIETITKTCPKCGAKMPINFGFITWCDQCDYNLENTVEYGDEKPKGMFPRLWVWMGKRSGQRLFKESFAAVDQSPRLTVSIILAFVVALFVHGLTLLMIAAAVTWLFWTVRDWGHVAGYIIFFRIIGALALLLITWKVRPHLGKMEKDVVRREQAGQFGLDPLFALADRISEALGSQRIQAIWISSDFTAGISQNGWKRDHLLMLGLPLLITLDRQELVGLIGHELAHIVNKDPQRTWLIHNAIHSLMEWADLFFIDRVILIGWGLAGVFNLVFQAVMRVLSLFAWLAGVLIALLIYPNMQRAEYRADKRSARLAGTNAVLTLMRKLYLRQSINNIYVKAYHYPETRIMQEIHERMCSVPDREWLRIDRVINKGESRLENTHPTTKDRIALLRDRPSEAGQVSLSMAEFGKIMDGLKCFEDSVERRIRKEMPAVRQ